MNRVLMPCLTVSILAALCVAAHAQVTSTAAGAQSQSPTTPTSQPRPPVGQNTPSAKVGVFVYPKNNQDAAQQQKDEGECYAWAKQQTGIDPDVPAPAPQETKQAKGGGAKGATRGAAGGAAVGAVAGDAGEGAAIGATAGAIRGRRQQKKANKQAQQQAEQQSSAQQQQAMTKVKNAFSSCIDARGYAVK